MAAEGAANKMAEEDLAREILPALSFFPLVSDPPWRGEGAFSSLEEGLRSHQ